MLEQIRRSNIRNYSIYREGTQLFAYFEYVGDDFAADMAAMAADPETQRWWALTDALQEPLPGPRARDVVEDAARDLPHRLTAGNPLRARPSRLRLEPLSGSRLDAETVADRRTAMGERSLCPDLPPAAA